MFNRPSIHLCTIVAFSATLFFTSLGKSRLWDRDEPRNAGCAAEMQHRGDFIVPIFNDELRHQKPVLLYWLMISAYQVFGVTEFAARFWSAILGVGTALLTYGIARRILDATVGFLAALILSSCIMFCVASRAATPDSTLIFFSTLGIYFYTLGTYAPSSDQGSQLKNDRCWFPQQWVYVALMNIAFGLGVLAKGPIGLIVPTAIIGMFLLIQRLEPMSVPAIKSGGRLTQAIHGLWRIFNPIHFAKTCWSMRPITAICVVLLIAAPWYIAVGIKTNGDFLDLFFLNENFARATSVMENHRGSWLYYPAAIAVGFFPWSIFLGPMVVCADQQLSKKTDASPAILFFVCWILVQVGLFSIAKTKLPSYITPCYPALAILTSFCLVRWLPSISLTGIRWNLAAVSTLILAGVVTTVGLLVAARDYFPAISWIAVLGFIPVVGGAAIFYVLWKQITNQLLFARRLMTGTAFLFCFFMFGICTVAVDSERQTNQITDQIRRAPTDVAIASYHCLESSWVFYARRPFYELDREMLERSKTQELRRKYFWDKKPTTTPEDFIRQHPNSMFVTTAKRAEELMNRLPTEFRIEREVDFFLKQGEKLVLIGRPYKPTAIATSDNQLSIR